MDFLVMKLVLMDPIYKGSSDHLKAKEAEPYCHRPLNLTLAKFPLLFLNSLCFPLLKPVS